MKKPPQKVAYLWQLGGFFSAALTVQNSPELHIRFINYFIQLSLLRSLVSLQIHILSYSRITCRKRWYFTNWMISSIISSTFNIHESPTIATIHDNTVFCWSTIWISILPWCNFWSCEREDFLITVIFKCSFTCRVRNSDPPMLGCWDLSCF